jgi:hypothetical protein
MSIPPCSSGQPNAPRPARLCLGLALALSLAPAPVHAAPARAPSERDLAYERAVQAEEAGDHVAAAGHYERAYQLTTPAETGPRLLFLRASVAARRRAFDGTTDARAHLCPARALLRVHLGATADLAPGSADPSLAERDSLAKIEQQIAAARVDCDVEPDLVPKPPDPIPDKPATDEPATDRPVEPPTSKPVGPEPPPATDPPGPSRNLRIAGGVTLGVGALGFAIMTGGIVWARYLQRRGVDICSNGAEACHAAVDPLAKITERGDRANQMIATGASIGAVGLVTGIVLLALGKRPARPRVAVTPGLTGLSLSGRF